MKKYSLSDIYSTQVDLKTRSITGDERAIHFIMIIGLTLQEDLATINVYVFN